MISNNKTIPSEITESQVIESQPTEFTEILTKNLISKNKRKKMERMEARKQKQKENKKRKKELKKENEKCQEIIKKQQPFSDISSSRVSKEKIRNEFLEKMRNGIRVCIDLSFTHLMTEPELKSCAFQIRHSYSINKHAKNPLHYYITSVTSSITNHFASNHGYQNWLMEQSSYSYLDIFPEKEIIYLVAESPNVLTELSSNFVYVIGGVVDHNRLKGVCNTTAIEKNIKTVRLPIQEYMTGITSRKVLTINQVFEILCEYSNNGSWESALVKGLPGRKGFILKSSLSAQKSTDKVPKNNSVVSEKEKEKMNEKKNEGENK